VDVVVVKPAAERLTEIVPEIQIHENGAKFPVAFQQGIRQRMWTECMGMDDGQERVVLFIAYFVFAKVGAAWHPRDIPVAFSATSLKKGP
jgi:hypothetical protein